MQNLRALARAVATKGDKTFVDGFCPLSAHGRYLCWRADSEYYVIIDVRLQLALLPSARSFNQLKIIGRAVDGAANMRQPCLALTVRSS
jgi:hypothetical protein